MCVQTAFNTPLLYTTEGSANAMLRFLHQLGQLVQASFSTFSPFSITIFWKAEYMLSLGIPTYPIILCIKQQDRGNMESDVIPSFHSAYQRLVNNNWHLCKIDKTGQWDGVICFFTLFFQRPVFTASKPYHQFSLVSAIRYSCAQTWHSKA